MHFPLILGPFISNNMKDLLGNQTISEAGTSHQPSQILAPPAAISMNSTGKHPNIDNRNANSQHFTATSIRNSQRSPPQRWLFWPQHLHFIWIYFSLPIYFINREKKNSWKVVPTISYLSLCCGLEVSKPSPLGIIESFRLEKAPKIRAQPLPQHFQCHH